jgi:hypothetical protein
MLASWRTLGLAVLWVPAAGTSPANRVALPAALAAVDVRTGQLRTSCRLPALTDHVPTVAGDYSLPMRQYPDAPADIDLMLRTQWLSPDFRWFAGPGLPLVEVSTGRVVSTPVLPGPIVGVGTDKLLLRTDRGWCTTTLPPLGDCTPLAAPAGPGAYVIGPRGAPTWLPATPVPFRFGPSTGYGLLSGGRLYRADTAAAGQHRRPVVSVDLDPAGLGGFPTNTDDQPHRDRAGWFSVAASGVVTYHRTTATPDRYAWMLGDADHASRALADSGRTAVSAVPALDGTTRITRFGALTDGTDQVRDLPVRCPVPDTYCRILAWPDGGTAGP